MPDGSDTGTDQGDERTVTVTGLANWTLHTFQVRAINSIGDGSRCHRDTGGRALGPGRAESLATRGRSSP